MPDVTATTEVARPARVVYDHFSDMGRLAESLASALSVRRTGGARFRWTLSGDGGTREWAVEVVENIIGERVVLAPVDGAPGPVLAVTVDDLGPRSRLTLSLGGIGAEDADAARRELDGDVDRLGRDVEARTPPAGDGPPVPPPAMAAEGDAGGGSAVPPAPMTGGDPAA